MQSFPLIALKSFYKLEDILSITVMYPLVNLCTAGVKKVVA